MPFPPSPNRDAIIQALRAGDVEGVKAADLIDEVSKRFPESRKTIERYAKQLREGTLKEPKGQKGGELATVLQPSKGAIIFTLGEHKISLNPQHLYDAYLYYQDIVVKNDIDEDFSLAIKDCLKFVWERFNQHRGETQGISITTEGG